MKVSDILQDKSATLSFEVFPPKIDSGFESVKSATEEISNLHPDFMSVTYGAGGTGSSATMKVAKHIHDTLQVPVAVHLTCVGSSKEFIDTRINDIQSAGIQNIMALRGDLPPGNDVNTGYFQHAVDLIAYLRSKGDWSIGGACYPEVHPESATQHEDLLHLKEKEEAGCDYFVSQMFFDTNTFYNFLYKAREAGITIPIVPGIMPITRAKQIGRAVQLSGTSVPARFRQIVDAFGNNPDAMEKAGIAYATSQIVDLIANGVTHIHVYSMNKSNVAKTIWENIKGLM